MTLRTRLFSKLKVLSYPRPHGLFAWSFFLGRLGPRERFHRAAMLARRQRWPLALWFVLQAWLALRWRLLHARRETRRALVSFGAAVQNDEGIPVTQQERVILSLACRYCIHPVDAYVFRLYRDPDLALDYVCDAETGGMHILANGKSRLSDSDALMDKVGFAERMASKGLPVAPTLTLLEELNSSSLERIALLAAKHSSGLFIKARRGSRAKGAFIVVGGPEVATLRGRFLNGRTLPGPEAVARALAALCRNDAALVQPRLGTDQALATGSEDAAVLRTITRRRPTGGGHELLSAHLRLPVALPRGPFRSVLDEVVLRVDCETGGISLGVNSALALLPETRVIEEATLDQLGLAPSLPSWDIVRDASLAAHDAHPQLWAVAWDWLLPIEGPCLLEGNVIWGMRRPQMMEGGMIDVVRQAIKPNSN